MGRVAKRITDRDVEIFTEGDCHILAETIFDLSGHPMYAFGFYVNHGNILPDLHVFNKLGRDKYLDVKGLRTKAEFMADWNPEGYYERVTSVTRKRLTKHNWPSTSTFKGSRRAVVLGRLGLYFYTYMARVSLKISKEVLT